MRKRIKRKTNLTNNRIIVFLFLRPFRFSIFAPIFSIRLTLLLEVVILRLVLVMVLVPAHLLVLVPVPVKGPAPVRRDVLPKTGVPSDRGSLEQEFFPIVLPIVKKRSIGILLAHPMRPQLFHSGLGSRFTDREPRRLDDGWAVVGRLPQILWGMKRIVRRAELGDTGAGEVGRRSCS